ncbi:hypothetical protein SESBI_23753 [Sesbania bispinosa]|nr:hypothetical protein SESBI_23753 [Sesbania bispinosa]
MFQQNSQQGGGAAPLQQQRRHGGRQGGAVVAARYSGVVRRRRAETGATIASQAGAGCAVTGAAADGDAKTTVQAMDSSEADRVLSGETAGTRTWEGVLLSQIGFLLVRKWRVFFNAKYCGFFSEPG